MYDGVRRIEDGNVLAGLADQIKIGAKANALHALEIRLSKIQMIHQRQIVRAQNGNLRAELIQVFAVRRNLQSKAAETGLVLPLILMRDFRGLNDLLLFEIDYRELGFRHFVVIRKFVDLLGDRVKQLSLWIGRSAANAKLLRGRIQDEMKAV